MNAEIFITSLQSRGAKLQVENDKLRVTPSHALTIADRAAWKAHKSEILRALSAASTCSADLPTEPRTATAQPMRRERPASTCARVALAAPTPDQIGAMDATSEADARELVQRLEGDGAKFLLNAAPGIWRFDGDEKLCVEYQSMSEADWQNVMRLRADIARIIAERRDAAADSTTTELTQNEGQGEIKNVDTM